MKITLRLLFALMLGAFALAARPALAADAGTAVKGMLIVASKQAGESDKRLASYEGTLRNILPGGYQTFRLLGEGSASAPAGGQATLNLAQGHRLELAAQGGANFNIRWLRGNAVLMEQPVRLNRGSPSVLGGPTAAEGEVFAVILIAN